MHKGRWVAVGAVVVAVGVVAALVVRGTRGSAAGPLRYLTATVQRGTVAQTVSATGTVQPARLLDLSFGSSGTVSSDASAASSSSTGSTGASTSGGGGGGGGTQGAVTAVYVKVGDRVGAGDPLARLDDGDAAQQLAVADAQLAAAQAKAALPATASSSSTGASSPSASTSTSSTTPIAEVARATPTPAPRRSARSRPRPTPTPTGAVQRTPTATPTPSAAQQAAGNAENALSVAQAESAVHTAQEAVAATVLRAPVSGRIVAVNVITGVVPPSSAAMEERSGTLQVQADVAEQDIASVRSGQRAAVTLPALGATERAVVTGMPTQATSSSSQSAGGASTVVTFPVTLTLRRPGRSVLPGMSAQVSLDIQRHAHVLYVPTTAIQGSTTAPTVQVLDDGRPVSRPVETGLSTNTDTEIVVGLRVGETVVTGVVNPEATATVDRGRLRWPRRRRRRRGLPRRRRVRRRRRRGRRLPARRGGRRGAMIEARGLERTYELGAARVEALRGVDVTVRAGEYVAISGPSGSGKSTLMHILGLLERPTAGTYRLDGTDTAGLDDDRLAVLRNRTIGFVFQAFHLIAGDTALENVAAPLVYRGARRADRLAAARAALERVGLGERVAHAPNRLSGGERQRVAIAAASSGTRRCCWPTSPPASSTRTPAPTWRCWRRSRRRGSP